jgi:hypothetical protein
MKQIKTLSGSAYLIDDKSKTFIRIKGEEATSFVNDLGWTQYDEVIDAEVGKQMNIYYTLPGASMPTLRTTTPVVTVEEIIDPNEGELVEISEEEALGSIGWDTEIEE